MAASGDHAPRGTIVFPSTSRDLDGVASAIACAELLNNARRSAIPWIHGKPDAEAFYVLSRCAGLRLAKLIEVVRAIDYVYVDGSSRKGLPPLIDPTKVVEVIDHRLHHKAAIDFPNAVLHIEQVGAAATLITERFRQFAVIPSRDSCILLYGAIHSNTQCLRGSVTSDRDRAASSWLETVCNMPIDLLDGQFSARREEILRDLAAAIKREQKEYEHETGEYAIAQLEFKGAGKLVQGGVHRCVTDVIVLKPRTMLNLVDVEDGSSHLIVPDPALRGLVAEHTGLKFSGPVARSRPAILRKQIVAAIEGLRWRRDGR